MPSHSRSPLFSILVYVAFFASGAASLIAEVTWNRMLIVVVGNSLSAAAMIISVFMGGLGLGSYLGGRFFARRRPSLVPYLLMELFIGVYVLLSPAVFDLLAQLFTSLAESTDARAMLTVTRIVVTLAALLIPATLMGATFPAMISAAATERAEGRTARTGYLYSVNTLGAAIGTFAGGYHLLLEMGVDFTLRVALGLYVGAALCALLASRLVASRGEPSEEAVEAAEDAEDAAPGAPRALRRYLAVATFGVGFVALAYEVLLTRMSILFLGNSVSVFPLVLTGFLLGTGFSAIFGTRLYGFLRRRTTGADRLFGVAALGAGAFILITPYLLLSDWVISTQQFARLADAAPRNPLPILGIIVAPTILMGALLPVAIRMLQPEGRGEATRGAATLYALNTAGGVIGAGLANHFLVPIIGVQGTLILLTGICTLLGLVNLLGSRPGPLRWGIATAGAVGLGVVLVVALPSMMDLYAGRLAHSTQAQEAEVLHVKEGRAATVTVIDQVDPRRGSYRDMYLNGVEEASTRYWHVQLFKLLGILPVVTHESDEPKDAVVIAFGAGITAGSVLASEEIASLDVVDLNPDIEGINDLFTEVNGDVFHEPRFSFQNDDGRNYLVTCNKRYDLIIGDSTHPRAYDSWILYTEEFYEAAKRRLKPNGIFAQWVPVLGSMRGELFQIHLNTFRKVFPHATFWYVYGSDQAFLMATPEPYRLDAARLQAKLDRLAPWFQAEEYWLDSVERIAGFFWLDEAAMGRMIGEERRVNTDHVHYFDKQSAVWPLPPQRQLPAFQTSVVPHMVGGDDILRRAVQEEQAVAGLTGLYGFFGRAEDLFDAYCRMPENRNVLWFMSQEFEERIPDPEPFCQNEAVRRYRTMVSHQPDNPLALNALADALSAAGQLEEALGTVERALRLSPRSGSILDTKGWILHRRGEHEAARTVLEQALEALPDHPIVLYHLGAVDVALGREASARRNLQRALEVSEDFPGREEARALLERRE